jgi:hypothetical protein
MKEGLIGLGKSVFATLPPKAIVAVLGIAAELAAPYLACKTADPATLHISQGGMKMSSVDTDKLMADLGKHFEVGSMAEMLDRSKINFWGAMIDGVASSLVKFAVLITEQLAAQYPELKGKDKEDLVVTYLDSHIHVTRLLDNKPLDVDGRIIRKLVRAAVAFYNNRYGGHIWPKKENGNGNTTVESTAGIDSVPADNPGNGSGPGTA